MCNACEKPKYYITTAIAYASSKPHIGNVYDIIMADATMTCSSAPAPMSMGRRSN